MQSPFKRPVTLLMSFFRTLCVAAAMAAGATHAELVHQYSFDDGTANDSVSGANGKLQKGAKVEDGVLTLGGDGGFVELPAGFIGTLTNFTISVWVKPDVVTNWVRVFDFGTAMGTSLFFTVQSGDRHTPAARFAITGKGISGEQQLAAPAALSAGTWTHIAITHSGATGILYIDGSPVATNTQMALGPASLGPTTRNYIGRSQYPHDPPFAGQIDELRIFDEALTPAGIIRKTYSTGAHQ